MLILNQGGNGSPRATYALGDMFYSRWRWNMLLDDRSLKSLRDVPVGSRVTHARGAQLSTKTGCSDRALITVRGKHYSKDVGQLAIRSLTMAIRKWLGSETVL
jgi:hypothetical protein